MKLKLTLLFLLFSILKSYTCSCSREREFNSKDDLKNYEFIAHVKITNIENIELEGPYHSMSFNIIELYKGEPLKNIIAFGYNRHLKRVTSCDLNENIGDEWIIFGSKSEGYDKLFTGYCTRSKKIKDSDGYENILYPDTNTLKKRLQILFEIKTVNNNHNGKRNEFYESGNKKLEEYYKNKKLHGERKLWYPNGVLESSQNYKKGIKDGIFKRYLKNGNIIEFEKFKNGIKIDTTTVWKNGRKKHYITSQDIYDNKGNIISETGYYSNGKKWVEIIYKNKKRISKSYELNGTLIREFITCKGRKVSEKEWSRLGELTNLKLYDKKGILIREND